MHYRGGAGAHFGDLHPLVFGEIGGDADVLIVDGAGGGDIVSFREFEDHVRRRDVPALGELARGGGVGELAFGGSGVDPRYDFFFLAGGQGEVVQKLSIVRVGRPGRHFAGDYGGANGFGPGARVLILEQRHGGHFAGAVATLAAGLEDGLDVLMKSWGGREGGAQQEERCGAESETHHNS